MRNRELCGARVAWELAMREAQSGGSSGNGLAELARSLLAEAETIPPDPGPLAVRSGDGFHTVLSMNDIVTDDSGACVLGVDGPKVSIVLQTDEAVVAEGAADDFASAAGNDVSGHSFLTFASGVTLYFPSDLDLALMPASA